MPRSGHIILSILSNYHLFLYQIPEVTKTITIDQSFEPKLREPKQRAFLGNQCILKKV